MRQAGLEQSIGWDVIRPYCEAGAYDVVMPDVKYIGGVHELRKVAGACADLGVAVSPHNPSGPISHAFSLQVSATLADFDRLEMQFDESPLFDALVGAPFPPDRRWSCRTAHPDRALVSRFRTLSWTSTPSDRCASGVRDRAPCAE